MTATFSLPHLRAGFRSIFRAGLQSGTIMTLADVTTQLAVEKREMRESPSAYFARCWGNLPNINHDLVVQQAMQLKAHFADSNTNLYSRGSFIPERTLRWLSAGFFCHGAFVVSFYGFTDRLFGMGMSTLQLARKTSFVVGIGLPAWYLILFTYMAVIERGVVGDDDDRVLIVGGQKRRSLERTTSTSLFRGQEVGERPLPLVRKSIHEVVVDKLTNKMPEALLVSAPFWYAATALNYALVPLSGRVMFVASCSALINIFLSYANAQRQSVIGWEDLRRVFRLGS